MAKTFSFTCSSCGAGYGVPESYRHALEGRAVFCAGCERWWVALPGASGPAVRLVKGRPERTPIDLRPFRADSSGPAQPTAAKSSPASASAPPASDATRRVPVPAPHAPLSLRVLVSAGGKWRKAVFGLGTRSFFIGQAGCHLNLPKAAIPARAVRVHAAERGFGFEGVDGFPIPIGSMSIVSGQIEPGGNVRLELPPYTVQLETSTTPGQPIADLEAGAGESPAPPPAPPRPSARPTQPVSPPTVELPGAVDLRSQLQEIAVDVRRDQNPFTEQQDALQAALDGDATITDLGARGFQASRFGNPLAGLELSLVRAEGPKQGQAFAIVKSPLVIGRKEGEMIIHDGRVSSKHAQLDVGGPRIYTLKDLASTNGTTVNDRPISVGHLEDGDVVSFGGVKFEFRVKLQR